MIPRHQSLMRNGWNIPQSMEWLFWPMGYQANATSRTFTAPEGSTVQFDATLSDTTNDSLKRRFKLTNRDAFLAQLRRLGAIKEQKP